MAELELVCSQHVFLQIMMTSWMLSLNLAVIILDPEDIVCVAESVVAITQRSFYTS